jgi:hypothetical protein
MKSGRSTVRTAQKAVANIKRSSRNLRQTARLVEAAVKVASARSKMATALTKPPFPLNLIDEAGEMTRLVPEKAIAFGAAGFTFLHHAARLTARMHLQTAHEWTALNGYALAVASARNPVARALAHGSGATAWWSRMMARSTDTVSDILSAQSEMMTPVRRTARANASRLS